MPFRPRNFFVIDQSLTDAPSGRLPVAVYKLQRQNIDTVEGMADPDQACIIAIRNLPNDGMGQREHIADLDVQCCGYAQNSLRFTTLPGWGGPDLMITAIMDGCTFGIGHSAWDGTCTVSHANSASKQVSQTDAQDMVDDQRNRVQWFFGTQSKGLRRMLQPADYRLADEGIGEGLKMCASATTFGVRSLHHWEFYRHRYLKGAGSFTYLDTEKIR